MRFGIKTWCDLHKRNADSLIKPSCGCRLCKELPKNHPINLSTILQECGKEVGEGRDGCEDAEARHCCSPSTRPTLRVLRFQPINWRMEKSCRGGGWEARGPAGVEEKNRLNVFTAALFFFTYFAQGSDFLLNGVGFEWAKGSAQQGLFTLRSRILLLRRGKGCWEGMEYFRVHMKAEPVKENAVHLNFKSRLATNVEKKKDFTFFLLNFDRKIVLQERWNVIPCNFLFHFSSSMMQKVC